MKQINVEQPCLIQTAFGRHKRVFHEIKNSKWLFLLVVFPVSLNVLGKPNLDFSLSVEEIYSDDVFRTDQPPAGESQRDSFISVLSPSFSISDQGANTDYRLNYQYRYNHYSNSGVDDRNQNELNASINRFVLNRSLRLYAIGTISNGRNQLSEQANDGLSGEELTETRSLQSGLAFQSGERKWHNTSSNLSYKKFSTSLNDEDEDIFSGQFTTANGSGSQNLFWTMQGNASKDSSHNQTERYEGQWGLNFWHDLAFFIQGDYENNTPNGQDEINSEFSNAGAGLRYKTAKTLLALAYNRELTEGGDDFVSVDASWDPTPRTSLSGSYSRRFFGEAYQFKFSHRAKRLSNNLSYTDSVTSFSRESQTLGFGFLVCPAGKVTDLTGCFVPTSTNPELDDTQQLVGFQTPILSISDELSLVRSLSHYTSYSKGKSSFTWNTFWNRSKSLAQGLVNNQDYTSSIGSGLSWSYTPNTRTNLALSGGWNTNESEQNSTNEPGYDDLFVRLSLTRNLSKKLIGSISYTYDERDAEDDLNSYKENRIGLSFTANL